MAADSVSESELYGLLRRAAENLGGARRSERTGG